MNIKEYYEQYWAQGTPPPTGDPTTEQRKELLKKALYRYNVLPVSNGHPKRILDAGCGRGEFLQFFGEWGLEAHGLDVADAAIEVGKARLPTTSFYTGSLEEGTPLPPRLFQAVWCSEVLEHLFDVRKALAELNRVIDDQGLLVLTTPYHGLFKSLAIELLGYERHYDVIGPHIRFFSRQSLAGCLDRSGFQVLSWSGVGRVWPLYKSFFVVARKVRDAHPPA